MLKGEKISIKKKLIVAWIVAIALIAGLLGYNLSCYAAYKKMQSEATIAMGIAMVAAKQDLDEYETDKELVEHFFYELEPYHGSNYLTVNGQKIDMTSLRDAKRQQINAAEELFEGLFGYSYINAQYPFAFTSFGEYLLEGKILGRYMPHEDQDITNIWAIVSVLFFVLLLITQIKHLGNYKDEIVVDGNVIRYKKRGKKTIEIPASRITGLKRTSHKGIKIKSPGAKVHITMLKNQVDIINAITDQMNAEKGRTAPVVAAPASAPVSAPVPESVSVVDELRELKNLLDSDIITQEEFDAKKKQLLDL